MTTADLCRYCILRGDYDKCRLSECGHHESWIDIERERRITELRAETKELYEALERLERLSGLALLEDDPARVAARVALGEAGGGE